MHYGAWRFNLNENDKNAAAFKATARHLLFSFVLMSSLKVWLIAFRLRTLPLALACLGMGSVLALYNGVHRPMVSLLALLTAVLLQILSNLANDYGDTQNGADLQGRIGPERMVASGQIGVLSMRLAILVLALLSFLSGLALLWVALANQPLAVWLGFLGLGILAILAAIAYTAGKKPYGYAGLGDLSVCLFFGPVAVVGSYFLHALSWSPSLLAPALSMGALAVAVLNLNNMRDVVSDRSAGKKTVVVRYGLAWARKYHLVLVLTALLLFLGYAFYHGHKGLFYAAALAGIAHGQTLLNLQKVKNELEFDPFLKQTALRTLLLTALSLLFFPYS